MLKGFLIGDLLVSRRKKYSEENLQNPQLGPKDPHQLSSGKELTLKFKYTRRYTVMSQESQGTMNRF